MPLRFVSSVSIRFYPLHPFAVCPRSVWRNTTTTKAKFSSPNCAVNCFISPKFIDPEVAVSYYDGTKQIFDAKTMTADDIRKEMKRVQDRIELSTLIEEMENTPDEDFTQYIAPVDKDKKKKK